MSLFEWRYHPSERVTPGQIGFGWTLSSNDVVVRWYVEPLQTGFPSTYQIAVNTSYSITQPGNYVFHLEAKDNQTGAIEERVVLFEITTSVDLSEEQSISLSTIPSPRSIGQLRTKYEPVGYYSKPDSAKMNRWMHDAVHDLVALKEFARRMELEMGIQARVAFLEQIARQEKIDESLLVLSAQQQEPNLRAMNVMATSFIPGAPEALGLDLSEGIVDRIYGELAPKLFSDPENKIGWPTSQGLRLPDSLSVTVGPESQSSFQSDPKHAIDGRPETAWIRETQLKANQEPPDVTYRIELPSGVSAQRLANRLDLACLPAWGVDIRRIRLFDGTSWSLTPGWPSISSSSGPRSAPISRVGPLRIRFADRVVAGVEIVLRSRFTHVEEGISRSMVGLYHLGLTEDPIAWSVRSGVHTLIESTRFPASGIRVEDIVPVFSYGDQSAHIQIRPYRVSPTGSWTEMSLGDALLGEGLGILVEFQPDADAGWGTVMTGVRVHYSLI